MLKKRSLVGILLFICLALGGCHTGSTGFIEDFAVEIVSEESSRRLPAEIQEPVYRILSECVFPSRYEQKQEICYYEQLADKLYLVISYFCYDNTTNQKPMFLPILVYEEGYGQWNAVFLGEESVTFGETPYVHHLGVSIYPTVFYTQNGALIYMFGGASQSSYHDTQPVDDANTSLHTVDITAFSSNPSANWFYCERPHNTVEAPINVTVYSETKQFSAENGSHALVFFYIDDLSPDYTFFYDNFYITGEDLISGRELLGE